MSSPQRPTVQVDTAQIITDMLDRGWNQAELARQSGVNEGTLSRFLRGDGQTPKTLAQIATTLGRKPSEYAVVTPAVA